MDEQIRLRDDVIFQLKQQMTTQQQRIADLEHIINELSQTPIKEEGTSINLTVRATEELSPTRGKQSELGG